MKKIIIVFMVLITSCGSVQLPGDFNKIENCAPVVFEIFQAVAEILLNGHGNWEQEIEGLVKKFGYEAVVCAIQAITDEWFDVRADNVDAMERTKKGYSSMDFAKGLDRAKYWLKNQQVKCSKVN